MADENCDPMQGEQGGENGTLGSDISEEALNQYINQFKKDGFLSLIDFPSSLQNLDDHGELADSQEAPQPEHPSPMASEHPQLQGKVEKSSVISKVDEMAVAGVDGKMPETDDEVPTCASVPKAFSYMGASKGKAGVPYSAKNTNLTALGGDKGVPMWSYCPKTNGNMGDSQAARVPTSATIHQAYSGGSQLETGVPTSATNHQAYSGGSLPGSGVPTSAASQKAYIGTSSKDSGVPMNARIETKVPPIMSANPSTEPQGARTGSQAMNYIAPSVVSEVGGQMNTLPGNGSTIFIRIGDTLLPSNMSYCVIRSDTDNGTTEGIVPPNPTVGTQLILNQPSTSKIDFKQNTGRKIKEDEIEEEEEDAGRKRQIGKTQEDNKRNKRRRQSKKQTEEEEEEEGKVPVYNQEPSNDPVQERKRKDAVRAKMVRDRKKRKMEELEEENKGLKEEKEKYKEEIDRLRRENEGLTAQVQGYTTGVAELLTFLRERFSIFVAWFGTPGQGPTKTAPGNPSQ